MSNKERSWSNILINPTFQLKLLGYFILLFILTTVSLYSTTYLFFHNMKTKGLKVGIPEGHVFFQFLQNQKHDLDLLFIGLAAFNFILLITVGFIITHRVAGPLYKLRAYLEDPDTNVEDLKFRQNDFFKELGPLVKKIKKR